MPSLEDEARELMARAHDNQKHQLYDEALRDLLRAEELQPYDYSLQHWLGSIYLEHYDDPSKALSHFDRAVRYATPRSNKAGANQLLSRARCKTVLGDLEGAYDDTREALFLDPTTHWLLYLHAAHAAATGREDEALSTLERSILGWPEYLSIASQDPRFEVLGGSLHAMLDGLRDDVTQALDSYVTQSRELEAAYSNWEILPRDLDADEYDKLYLPLTEAQSALSLGDYPEQVKALQTIRQALPAFVDWIDQKLAAAVSSAERDIDYAESRKFDAEDDARSYDVEILKTLLRMLGPLAAIAVGVVIFVWGIDLERFNDFYNVVVNVVKFGGLAIALGAAGWGFVTGFELLKEMLEHARDRTRLLESTSGYADDESKAERKLKTLQAQQESYQKYLERARLN